MSHALFHFLVHEALMEVRDEIMEGDARPYPTDDPVRCAALVCEEAGETIQAALDLTRASVWEGKDRADLHKEARHTAAMAVKLMMTTAEGQMGCLPVEDANDQSGLHRENGQPDPDSARGAVWE